MAGTARAAFSVAGGFTTNFLWCLVLNIRNIPDTSTSQRLRANPVITVTMK